MPEFAGASAVPPSDSDLGMRPIVVTCDGIVMHVEPAPRRRETDRRIKEIAAALYALPWAASTVDDPPHAPYRPGQGGAAGWRTPARPARSTRGSSRSSSTVGDAHRSDTGGYPSYGQRVNPISRR